MSEPTKRERLLIPSNADSSSNEDVVDVVAAPLRRRRASRLVGLASVSVLLLCAFAASYAAWTQWWVPRNETVIVEAAWARVLGIDPAIDFKAGSEEQLRALAQAAFNESFFAPPEPEIAVMALRKAARGGSDEALLDLGVLHRDGRLGSPDSARALALFDQVKARLEPRVRAGEGTALRVLARMQVEGLGVAPNRPLALETLSLGLREAPAHLLHEVAVNAKYGRGTFFKEQDEGLALKLMQRAAESGRPESMLTLADWRYAQWIEAKNDPLPQRVQSARRLFLREAHRWSVDAAEKGYKEAYDSAGNYSFDLGEFREALKWLEKIKFPAANLAQYHRARLGVLRIVLSESVPTLTSAGVTELAEARRSGESLQWWLTALDLLEQKPSSVDIVHRAAALTLALDSQVKPEFRNSQPLADAVATASPSARAQVFVMARVFRAALEGPPATISVAATGQAKGAGGGGGTVEETGQTSKSGLIASESSQPRTGRSSLVIDNGRGAGDAVVRLYRDGKLPAAYSYTVRQGDSFTGAGIQAGQYVLRYRSAIFGPVLEVDQRFVFEEVKQADGVRFTRATVTLFGVPDGNIKTRPVDQALF